MEIKHIDDTNFEQEVTNSKGKVLVDFFATWCPPCKMLSPILEDIAQENDDFQIAKLDIDQAEKTSFQFGVMSVPTMILFVDGQEKARMIGLHSKNDVLDFINNN